MTIVEKLRTDRESGARRLESEYKAGLMTLARRFCADEGDAEALVNRTLAAVVEGIDDYLEQSAFFGWMCKILENLHAKDVRRKSSRTVAGDAEAVDGARDDEVEDRIFREVDASLLRDAIAELPADMKDVLMLRYFMDLPVSRVARILAAPEGTVKWRLHCARMVLAAKLGAQRPVARLVLLALLLAAGLAAGRALYTLGTAVLETRAERAQLESHAENAESVSHAEFAESVSNAEIVSHAENAESAEPVSHAESAESVSHAEFAESAESVSHAENAESAEPTPSTPSTPSTFSTVPTVSTPDPSAMHIKSFLAAASLALAAAPASAGTDGWTYTPPASGTRGTISWTDSSGFENVVQGAVLSNGLISFARDANANSALLRNLDLSIPVHDRDGTTQYAFAPTALGDATSSGRIVRGAYLTNVVLHAGCKSVGRYSFKECTALARVTLNDGLESIGAEAFSGDTALVAVENLLPASLQSVGDNAFYDCPIRGHVLASSGLRSIGARAFRGARIETFTAERTGLRTIGEYAFSGCSLLTNVVLSSELESISGNWVKETAAAGGGHVWFRNLPATLSSSLWTGTTKQKLTIHLPWSQETAWREWVATGPSGHTFTFNGATKRLPEHRNDVGTWQAGVTQNVTWWKDRDASTLVLVK